MSIRKSDDGTNLPARDITPPETYFNRRSFLRGAALVGGVAATAGVYRALNWRSPLSTSLFNIEKLDTLGDVAPSPLTRDQRITLGYDVDEAKTPFEDIAGYNNYYEFSTDKRAVAALAQDFVAKPWTLTVDGLVNKPQKFDLDDLKKVAALEERVYRHRCVERWSMVIPWLGFPLAALLAKVDPKADAKYVAFQSFFEAKQMPHAEYLPFPYHEGLRLDEAMHPLTLLAMGVYGKVLLPQNGAPIRLVCPWKYGFKNAKAIVRISLVKDQPATSWNDDQPNAYGFYCNVNPAVARPWDQSQEDRHPDGPRATLPFNGYATQVAGLYKGMDLAKFY